MNCYLCDNVAAAGDYAAPTCQTCRTIHGLQPISDNQWLGSKLWTKHLTAEEILAIDRKFFKKTYEDSLKSNPYWPAFYFQPRRHHISVNMTTVKARDPGPFTYNHFWDKFGI